MAGQQPQNAFNQNQLPSLNNMEEKKDTPNLPAQFEGKLPLPHFNFPTNPAEAASRVEGAQGDKGLQQPNAGHFPDLISLGHQQQVPMGFAPNFAQGMKGMAPQ